MNKQEIDKSWRHGIRKGNDVYWASTWLKIWKIIGINGTPFITRATKKGGSVLTCLIAEATKKQGAFIKGPTAHLGIIRGRIWTWCISFVLSQCALPLAGVSRWLEQGSENQVPVLTSPLTSGGSRDSADGVRSTTSGTRCQSSNSR